MHVCTCVYVSLPACVTHTQVFHANPTILHYKNKQNNGIMAAGHVFTIEPMINEGDASNVMWKVSCGNPKPATLNHKPQPQTPNPKPHTLNRKP